MASALKKIQRAKPTAQDIRRALAELDTDGPRGTVVLGHALIDDAMRSAIMFHMRPLTDDGYNELFRGTSPLATSSAMIKVGYAFKVIGSRAKRDLDKLRELRNTFAHTQSVLTFESEPVLNLLRTFECLDKIEDKKNLDGRRCFRTIVRFYLIYFISKLHPERENENKELTAGFDD